jgi:hypothetical protein
LLHFAFSLGGNSENFVVVDGGNTKDVVFFVIGQFLRISREPEP